MKSFSTDSVGHFGHLRDDGLSRDQRMKRYHLLGTGCVAVVCLPRRIIGLCLGILMK